MYRIALAAMICLSLLAAVPGALAQTTSGLVTGTVSDATGALIQGVRIDITNMQTGVHRQTTSGSNGIYTAPDLLPGIYKLAATKEGFGSVTQLNVELQVNQNLSLNFTMGVADSNITVDVKSENTGMAPTSSTLNDVINHDMIIDLPLNGREFTQLTLLTPGAAPLQAGQQTNNIVSRGAGGISPAVNGQRPRQNNYTMDGVANNNMFANIWAISPPPDALEQFKVQSHITDAQFAVSTGANINIVTKSGTNSFHGALWEFVRNQIFDAQTFPATERLPYTQNQYGVVVGGPVLFPHFNGHDNTWFSAYWSGFRSYLTEAQLSTTFTAKMRAGDFSEWLGANIAGVAGKDHLGRQMKKFEIYDPATSRPDPTNASLIIRDPFDGNIIPSGRISHAASLILDKYYPLPNIEGKTAANLLYNQETSTLSDDFGIRIDHRLGERGLFFGRFNRQNVNAIRPRALPTQALDAAQFAQVATLGYTYILSPNTVLDVRYGFSHTYVGRSDSPVGAGMVNDMNFLSANPEHDGQFYGPTITIANGISAFDQQTTNNGPQNNSDYHADLTKVIGRHTLGMGSIYYHVNSFTDGRQYTVKFTQNATGQGGLTTTGVSPASFLLGLPDGYTPTLGNTAGDQTVNWYGAYVQDQWRATAKLTMTLGLRWDYVAPPDYHKTVSAFNPKTGRFLVNAPVPPAYLAATAGKGIFNSQFNGFEPRFGLTFAATSKTVIHSAFAMLDDHNNTLVQENQDLRVSWPNAVAVNRGTLNRGLPDASLDNMPAASTFLTSVPLYVSFGVDENNKIPYSLEYNVGVQQQMTKSMTASIDYVGSVSRHNFIEPLANTAKIPGTTGSLASRGQPYPQYSSPFSFDMNGGSGSYNSLQVKLKQALSSNVTFLAAYTYSKTMDIQSDAYVSTIQSIYDIPADWGPADFDFRHLFVISGVYKLPVGRGQVFLNHAGRLTQAALGGWQLGIIASLVSGSPFNALAGSDIAGIGTGTGASAQRANKIGDPYHGPGFQQTRDNWVNSAAFSVPTAGTFGNEGRNDLEGPGYRDVDVSLMKNFLTGGSSRLQLRVEAFNITNVTNFASPTANAAAPGFGQIIAANGYGRIMQFAAKFIF